MPAGETCVHVEVKQYVEDKGTVTHLKQWYDIMNIQNMIKDLFTWFNDRLGNSPKTRKNTVTEIISQAT